MHDDSNAHAHEVAEEALYCEIVVAIGIVEGFRRGRTEREVNIDPKDATQRGQHPHLIQ